MEEAYSEEISEIHVCEVSLNTMLETYSEDISKTRVFKVSFIYVVMKIFHKGAHSIKNPIR